LANIQDTQKENRKNHLLGLETSPRKRVLYEKFLLAACKTSCLAIVDPVVGFIAKQTRSLPTHYGCLVALLLGARKRKMNVHIT